MSSPDDTQRIGQTGAFPHTKDRGAGRMELDGTHEIRRLLGFGEFTISGLTTTISVQAPLTQDKHMLAPGKLVGITDDGRCLVQFEQASDILVPFSYLKALNPHLQLPRGFVRRREFLFGSGAAVMGIVAGAGVRAVLAARTDTQLHRQSIAALDNRAGWKEERRLAEAMETHHAALPESFTRDATIGAITFASFCKIMRMLLSQYSTRKARRFYGDEREHARKMSDAARE